MATIHDWYRQQSMTKEASVELAPGEALLQQAGIVKEAGWLGRLVGMAIGKPGKWLRTAGEAGAKRAKPKGLMAALSGKATRGGERMMGTGGRIRTGSRDTTSIEDLKRFYRSKYFKPAAVGTGIGAAGLATGYGLGRRGRKD
jgi:hypothetical protein